MEEERLAIDLTTRVEALRKLGEKIDEINITLKAYKDEYDNVERDVAKMMESTGLSSLKLKSGGMVVLTDPMLKAHIKAGQREEAFKWMKENNMGYLVTETVHHDNLNRIVRERIAAGENIPEDSIGYSFIRQLRLRK